MSKSNPTQQKLVTNKQQIHQVLTRGVAEVLPQKETLAKLMQQRSIKLYLGIDPTGSFLHLGHAVVLRKLQQFAQLGHEVILLVGNGTVKIGDPTGRDASRPMLTDQEIEQNFRKWQKQASKILDFSLIKIEHNGDWLDQLKFPQLVKLMAKTTLQQLMERDMFQQRLKENLPIFAHELIYPLIQGYDSVAMNVDLEIGGTDQTFNIMMGRTLQKAYHDHEKWVLTTPLIEGTDGRKMSKSFNNYVALTAEPKQIYGKLMSIKDELILKYFKLLTDIDLAEIKQMQVAMREGANPMQFKKRLALTITTDLHNAQAAQKAQQHFEKTVQQGDLPNQIPSIKLTKAQPSLLEVLKACQPKTSNNQLRRLVKQGAVRLMPADQKLTDPQAMLTIKPKQIIRVGKRHYYQLVIS